MRTDNKDSDVKLGGHNSAQGEPSEQNEDGWQEPMIISFNRESLAKAQETGLATSQCSYCWT